MESGPYAPGSAGFAEYVGVLAGGGLPMAVQRLIGAFAVLLFLAVNLVGAKLVDRAQKLIIAAELLIIALLLAAGSLHADFPRIITTPWPSGAGVVTGAALLYVTFQGFGVVTNASDEMRAPRRELPRQCSWHLAWCWWSICWWACWWSRPCPSR